MNEETEPRHFTEHHQRHVRTTFQYIDKLVSEAEHTMADAGSKSPFQRHSDDTTPTQKPTCAVSLVWNHLCTQ
jgi:hypothetical protein